MKMTTGFFYFLICNNRLCMTIISDVEQKGFEFDFLFHLLTVAYTVQKNHINCFVLTFICYQKTLYYN
jgi:hypothetical protein